MTPFADKESVKGFCDAGKLPYIQERIKEKL